MGASSTTPEEKAKCAAEEVLSRFPEAVLIGTPFESESDSTKMSPLSIVLLQEAERYTKLLNVIRTSLEAVIETVKGICLYF